MCIRDSSYIAPSVIAMVLAWVIHPVAKRLENVFRKIKLPAKLASLIAVIVMYGIVSFILFWIGARVVEELRSLIAALPGWVSQASDFIQKWSAEGLSLIHIFQVRAEDHPLLHQPGEDRRGRRPARQDDQQDHRGNRRED